MAGPPIPESSDWSAVTRLCRRGLAMLPELARASTTRIRADLPDYGVVPLGEHLEAVSEQQRRRLEAISQRRPLDDSDLEQAARLARRRARQGISVDVLIGAYHVGDRELWRVLCAHAEDAQTSLAEVASFMLESLHAISTVLASAHAEVSRQIQGHRITLSQRLVELLGAAVPDPEATRISAALGFEPEGEFVAVAWRPDRLRTALPPQMQRELDLASGSVAYAHQGEEVVFLTQGADAATLAERAATGDGDGTAGIGLARPFLDGAALSIGDARLALAATSRTRAVCRFADVWHEVCLLSQAQRLTPLTESAVAVARAHPHLAAAVLGYASADMSLAHAAKQLHLHPNTVTYRLDRWRRLAGWDARTFEGLSRSVVACRIALP